MDYIDNIEVKNVFYFANLNVIGGVESFFYYLVRKYNKNDIIVYYQTGDIQQIKRLHKYARVKRYDGQKIICEKAFFNYNLDIINNVTADEYIQIIHADYKTQNIEPNLHPKINKYIGVSKEACNSFKEITGQDIELCYNPVVLDKPKRVLHLISATRLTKEKGKERMIKFAKMLDKAKIPYLWTVFTNDINAIDNPNIVYMKPRLDISNYIADADYLVQLSSSESFCFSVVESLMLSTPVIVTNCPVFQEIGLNETNSFILDFDLDDVPIEEIYKGLPKFKYKPPKDEWNKYLAKGKSTYNPDDKTLVKIKPIVHYLDVERQENLSPQSPSFIVPKSRADLLCSIGFCEFISYATESE